MLAGFLKDPCEQPFCFEALLGIELAASTVEDGEIPVGIKVDISVRGVPMVYQ